MLHEVKAFTERHIPDIDISKLWDGFTSVCSVKLINATAVTEIKELVNLLKSFGTIEDRFSESQQEDRTRFMENMAGVAEWFQAEFKPQLPQANELLTKWTASRMQADAKDGVALSLAEVAQRFSPMEMVGIPIELDESFHLQCAMTCSVVSGC